MSVSFTEKERSYLKNNNSWHAEVNGVKSLDNAADPMDPIAIPDNSGNFVDAFYNNKVKKYFEKIEDC